MKKKFLSIISILSLVVSLCCMGCGNNRTSINESNEQVKETEQVADKDNDKIKSDLDSVYNDVCKMDEECQYISSCILTYWDVNGAWTFEGLFDKSYGSSAKQEWKNMRDKVFSYREDVKELQSSIPTKLKSIEETEDLKEYKDAISDMFIEINSFATIVTDYPNDYTKITYSNLISEYKTNVEKAKSVIELEK